MTKQNVSKTPRIFHNRVKVGAAILILCQTASLTLAGVANAHPARVAEAGKLQMSVGAASASSDQVQIILYKGSSKESMPKVGSSYLQADQQLRQQGFDTPADGGDVRGLAEPSSAAPQAPDASSIPKPTESYSLDFPTDKLNAFRVPGTVSKGPVNQTTQLQSPTALAASGIDFDACRVRPKADAPYGEVINHFNYCAWTRYAGLVVVNSTVQGSLGFDEVTVGEAYLGVRGVDVSVKLNNFSYSGAVTAQTSVTLSITSNGLGGTQGNPAPQITGSFPASTLTVAGWPSSFSSWRLVSDASTGRGLDKISRGTFQTIVSFSIPSLGYSNAIAGQIGSNRYDSAGYLSTNTSAAIFDRVVPSWPISRSEPTAAAVAVHMNDALTNPNTTFPPKDGGKRIPGSYPGQGSYSALLHRLYEGYDPTAYSNNTSAKDKACNQLPVITGTDCDEFPMAATYEGAGKGDGNFSVRRINSSQNRAGGGLLQSWYRSDRILHGDSFYVYLYGPTPAPVGSFDGIQGPSGGQLQINGWTAMQYRPGVDLAVDISITGPSGRTDYRGKIASGNRPDVANALTWAGSTTGFSVPVTPQGSGSNTVCVSAVSPIVGLSGLSLGCKTIQIYAPVGSLDGVARTGTSISVGGWAADQSFPGRDVEVHIYVTGPNGRSGTPGVIASQSRADVASVFPWAGGTTGFNRVVPSMGSGSNEVCAFAIGASSNTLLGCKTVIM